MKSPLTGKPMQIVAEWRTLPFRKEEIRIAYQSYRCEDTGEHFTDTALDEMNIRMLHQQYRAMHHIPTVEEIQETRAQYGLSAAKMNELLGFGPNTYGKYEKGEVPSLPNAKLLRLAADPKSFARLVEDWEAPSDEAKKKLLSKIEDLIDQQTLSQFLDQVIMGSAIADEYTGFRKPRMERLIEMVVYFAHEVPSYKTKMNKLLFYADFLHFKRFGTSISGARYRAIPYGPVPHRYETLYEQLAETDIIDNYYQTTNNGSRRDKLVGREDRKVKESFFNKNEREVLDTVAQKFKKTPPTKIVDISHEEAAWLTNQASRSEISYFYSFELKALS
ncbi:MAG: DUF4065 domain-containing protein [Ekhidna sp.]